MTKDPKGRLLLGAQRGQPITRVTLDNGKVVKEEILHIPVSERWACCLSTMCSISTEWETTVNSVCIAANDTKGDDSYDDRRMPCGEWQLARGRGEHGAHGIVLGPDKMLYMVCGNFTDPPADLAATSPHRNYADDIVLKRAEDGNGFGAGKLPPGGFVARMGWTARTQNYFRRGQRNTYDIGSMPTANCSASTATWNTTGGAPWYRPIRVFHAVRGGEHGFREGSAKWPEYYFDGLPRRRRLELASPTGVVFGTGAKFPLKYQRLFFICELDVWPRNRNAI